MNILEAINDLKVFAPFFEGNTWKPWRAFLASLFALPMTPEQLAIYQQHTGRKSPPASPFLEAWLVIGRRGGKSFVLALIAVFLACFKDWRPFLGPGEVGTIMVIAADRRQSRVIMRYCLGLLKSVPMLARQIENVTRETITLKNSITIEIHTASFRTTRGYSIVAALLDEVAYWPTDETSAEVDSEVINAIRPGMATIPNAMLLCASSPHARKGALWTAYRKHHGQDGDPVLVWQAPTRAMNPSVPQSFIDAHLADDRPRACAEYLAQFRSDLEAYVRREIVEACVAEGVYERAPLRDGAYVGFTDASGGMHDAFSMAIAHNDPERGIVVIDAVRERTPPFSPESVVREYADLLRRYHIFAVTGDRYGGQWVAQEFSAAGIEYVAAERPKSQLFADLLPVLNSCRIEILDHPKLINQICCLERRVTRGGRDLIAKAPGAFDDLANATAGVASLAANPYGCGGYDASFAAWQPNFQDRDADPARQSDANAEWRRARLAAYLLSGGQTVF